MKRFATEDLFLHRRIAALDARTGAGCAVCETRQADREADHYRHELWSIPLDGREPYPVTHGGHSDSSPKLSPDGKRVAFLSARGDAPKNVYVLDLERGGEARALTRFGGGGATSLEWSPDGASLLVKASVPVDPAARGASSEAAPEHAPKLAWRVPYKADGVGFTLDREIHLFVVDAGTGKSTRLTRGPFDVQSIAWSPDSRRIAYVRSRTGREAHRADVWVCDADGGNHRQITHRVTSPNAPAWSPDGRTIAFAGAVADGESRKKLWLADVDVDGGNERMPGDGYDVESASSTTWAEDGKGVLFIHPHRGRQRVVCVEAATGACSTLIGGERLVVQFNRTDDGFVFLVEQLDGPTEVLACDADGSNERRLSDFNAWWREREQPRIVVREFDVPDGNGGTEKIDGWLLLPPNAQGPVPLVFDAHGGPHSIVRFEYEPHVYWYALCARGFGVVLLNSAGSSSYGDEFALRLRGRWGELDLPQYLAVADTLEREGVGNGTRAVSGKSYGGYLAAWAIGNCDLFQAAVVAAPVANLESHYGTSDSGYFVNPFSMNGETVLDRKLSTTLSPMRHMTNCVTPTLILQGEEDQRCPKGQAEELFVALMHESKARCELVLYPGGHHGLAEEGRPSHRLDYHTRAVEWIVEHCTERAQSGAANECEGGSGQGSRAESEARRAQA